MTSLQSKSAGALLSALGTRGHSGITCAAHDGDATQLDITIESGAWAVLADGTVLADELASTHISGLSIAGTYTLWLDYREVAADYEPVWTVAAIAPTSSALDICTVEVGAGGISSIGATEGGLRSLPQQRATATLPAGVPVLRGTHDVTSGYAPGDVVTDGGGLYVTSVAVVLQRRADTFSRPDQDGWGRASDGHLWVRSYTGGTDSVAEAHGVQVADADGTSTWLLGPDLDGDLDVLVRWAVTSTTATDGLYLFVRKAADPQQSYAGIYLNGTTDGAVINATGTADTWSGTWAGSSSGSALWTRLRVVGDLYRYRTWADGDAEPSAWDVQHTATVTTTSGKVGLAGGISVDQRIALDHFSATTLAPAPAADPEHWTALAPAPAQAGTPVLHGPATFDHATASNNDTITLYTPAAGDVLLRLFADPASTAAWDKGEVRAMVGSTELASSHSTIDVSTPYVFTDSTPLVGIYTIGAGDTSSTGHTSLCALIAHPVAP